MAGVDGVLCSAHSEALRSLTTALLLTHDTHSAHAVAAMPMTAVWSALGQIQDDCIYRL